MEDGWPKGYCYVEYEKLNDAIAACEDLQTKNQVMFYGRPLQVAFAVPPRRDRGRLSLEPFTQTHGGRSSTTERMNLLDAHLDKPVHGRDMTDDPRQSVAAPTSDGTAAAEPPSESPPKDTWENYGFKQVG